MRDDRAVAIPKVGLAVSYIHARCMQPQGQERNRETECVISITHLILDAAHAQTLRASGNKSHITCPPQAPVVMASVCRLPCSARCASAFSLRAAW